MPRPDNRTSYGNRMPNHPHDQLGPHENLPRTRNSRRPEASGSHIGSCNSIARFAGTDNCKSNYRSTGPAADEADPAVYVPNNAAGIEYTRGDAAVRACFAADVAAPANSAGDYCIAANAAAAVAAAPDG